MPWWASFAFLLVGYYLGSRSGAGAGQAAVLTNLLKGLGGSASPGLGLKKPGGLDLG